MQERAFFVINKIDDIDSLLDQPEQVPAFLTSFLSTVPALKGIKVSEERVFCISAKHALWGRMLRSRTVSAALLQEIKKACFGVLASKQKNDLVYGLYETLLENSNFTKLEDSALKDMASSSFKLLIEGVRHDLKDILNQVIRSAEEQIQIIKNANTFVEQYIHASQNDLQSIITDIKDLLPNAIKTSNMTVEGFSSELMGAINKISLHPCSTTKFTDETQAKKFACTISNGLFTMFSVSLASLKSVVELELLHERNQLAKKAEVLVVQGVASITARLNEKLLPAVKFTPISTRVKFSHYPVFLNMEVDVDEMITVKKEEHVVEKQTIEEYQYDKAYFVEEYVNVSESDSTFQSFLSGLAHKMVAEKKAVEKTRKITQYRTKIVKETQEMQSWEVDGDAVKKAALKILQYTVASIKELYQREVEWSLTHLLAEAETALKSQVTGALSAELERLDAAVEEQKERISSLEKLCKEAQLLQEQEKALVIEYK